MKRLSVLIGISLMVAGCGGGGFRPNAKIGHEFSFVASDSTDLIPVTDKISAGCLSSPADTCIYLKNPVAQSKAAVSDANELVNLQTFAAKITDTDRSGFLQNKNFAILTMKGARVSLFEPGMRRAAFAKTHSYVEQTMSYYWLNRAVVFLKNRVGDLPAENKNVKIYVGAPNTGWASKTNSIHLGDRLQLGLSAEVLVSLWGEANASFASGGAISDLSGDANHKACQNDLKGCCATKSGCSKALLSGVGDFVSLIVFSDQPRLGESIANDYSGQSLCGFKRDVSAFASVQSPDIIANCIGSVPAMGFLYASIWWEVRNQAADKKSVELLFFRHLKDLNGSDTLSSAKAKILALAPNYGPDLANLFQQEFANRQL